MKKTLAVLMCILLTVFCGFAAADLTQKEDYTVVTVNGAFSIRGVTPEGYHLADTQNMDTTIWASFTSDDPSKPYFDLIISFVEEYANVGQLNDLSEAEMKEMVDDDPDLSEKIDIMETDYGTKVMILRSNDPMNDYACFVTIYKGYEVGLNLFPGMESEDVLTDEQIKLAMKFLSDLDFVPMEAGR